MLNQVDVLVGLTDAALAAVGKHWVTGCYRKNTLSMEHADDPDALEILREARLPCE